MIDKKRTDVEDSDRYSGRKGTGKEDKREHLSEVFNFSCVLRGEVKYLERIKEYIVQEYVKRSQIDRSRVDVTCSVGMVRNDR